MDETAAHALLGVIDPVRHGAFLDRYVGLPLDLTGVLFVAAAAEPGRIPPLLAERLELLPCDRLHRRREAAHRGPASDPATSRAARVVGR